MSSPKIRISERVVANLVDERIRVSFSYSGERTDVISKVPGARFVARDKGGPYWSLPKELETARTLNRLFNGEFYMKEGMRDWAVEILEQEDRLMELALADHAELTRLPEVLPELMDALYVGPRYKEMTKRQRTEALKAPTGSYQTADVAYLAAALREGVNPLNGIHPGLGKSLETIAAIHEANQDEGSHLVICPVSSIEVVWQRELEQWQDHPVLVAPATNRDEREIALMAATELHEEGEPFWLIVNPGMVQYKGIYEEDEDTRDPITGKVKKILVDTEEQFPEMFGIQWTTVVTDEIHKAGFRNLESLTAKAIFDMPADTKIGVSGTPVGGRPENLWKILHYLNPDRFPSKWRWAEQWLEVEMRDYGGRQTKVTGNIRPELEEEFYKAHAQYFLRRTKKECAPWLPDKQRMDHWAQMTPAQRKQYNEFALEAEVKIDEYELSATSILAEYTRLKQFAVAKQTVEQETKDGRVILHLKPTYDSGKLEVLEEVLGELGIFDGGPDQAIIFSQFTEVCKMVYNWLSIEKKVACDLFIGETKGKRRAEIEREFQAREGASILVMNTDVGGVSITLDQADTVIFMDETWVPDNQEQAEDRVHRASRIHQVTCHYIRTKGTIEEYIQARVAGKEVTNKIILDLRRQGFRANRG
jgi:SNF2 family DNA or RNA helicase